MAFVLKPVRRHHGGHKRRSYHRRNPEVMGTPVGEILSVGAGAYFTRQLAGAFSGVAAPLTKAIDKFKTGLGTAALSGLSAGVVGWGVGKWRRHYGDYARLGGLAIAFNQGAAAFVPGFDPLAGLPAIGQDLHLPALTSGSQSQAKTQSQAAAQPTVQSQL